MSASSHTRDHRFAAELTAAVLAWLVRWGRRVVNGPAALDLEISKARQYAALEGHGIATPRTVLVGGRERVVAAALRYFADQPVILKPNRGGKGLGVQLFASVDSLGRTWTRTPMKHLWTGSICCRSTSEPSARSSRAPNSSAGASFTLSKSIPATASNFARQMRAPSVTPTVRSARRRGDKFTIIDGIPSALRTRLERFLTATGIEVAGIEFITDNEGRTLVYDVNTNTNYNPDAEARSGAPHQSVWSWRNRQFLGAQLHRLPAAA